MHKAIFSVLYFLLLSIIGGKETGLLATFIFIYLVSRFISLLFWLGVCGGVRETSQGR